MTHPAATTSSRPRAGLVVVVLAVLLAALLWSGTGNSFAAHMGADTAPGQGPTAVAGSGGGTTAGTADGGGTVTHDAESSHVLHLLGGCIAVLGAALLLLGAWVARGRPPRPQPRAARVVAPGRPARAWWRPPALSPPTTSPVLRT